ncbi:hypothetical protein J6590_038302, partial [Homalodisca vitripennis]
CFLLLLLVAAVLWKIKQKYDMYRRRQRLFVEMEQMASRPFSQVLVEIEKRDVSAEITAVNNTLRRRKKDAPSPIALEPCCGNRAAVLSLLVRLPTGSERFTPPGQSDFNQVVTPGHHQSAVLQVRSSLLDTGGSCWMIGPDCERTWKHLFKSIQDLSSLICPGLAIASALVTLGNPRKVSLDPTTKTDKTKSRKSLSSQHPDSCM